MLLSFLPFFLSLSSAAKIALYWGQNSAGSQLSLGQYCESSAADIYIISFLYQFPSTSLNIVGCDSTYPDGLLHCPQVAADIKKCQANGKKVLLSLGGAVGQYGFTTDLQAQQYATTLWNTFGAGSGSENRPFDDAIVDGFDLDIENSNQVGYSALVDQLRLLYNGQDYYIGAAPQCPFPDASLGNVLQNSHIDFVFVQFYNNYCSIGSSFNWDTWSTYATSISPNKNVQIYLGLPGSSSAAGSGYVDIQKVQTAVDSIKNDPHFGGVMMWDASQAFGNKVDGVSYVEAVKQVLGGSTNGQSSEQASSATVQSSEVPATSSASTVSVSSIASTQSPVSVNNGQWTAEVPTTSSASTVSVSSIASTQSPVSVNNGQWTAEASASSSASTVSVSSVISTVSPVSANNGQWTAEVPATSSASTVSVSSVISTVSPASISTQSPASANNGQWTAEASATSSASTVSVSSIASTQSPVSANNGQWTAEVPTTSSASTVSVSSIASTQSPVSVNNGQWTAEASATSSASTVSVSVSVSTQSPVSVSTANNGQWTPVSSVISTVSPASISTQSPASANNGQWTAEVPTTSVISTQSPVSSVISTVSPVSSVISTVSPVSVSTQSPVSVSTTNNGQWTPVSSVISTVSPASISTQSPVSVSTASNGQWTPVSSVISTVSPVSAVPSISTSVYSPSDDDPVTEVLYVTADPQHVTQYQTRYATVYVDAHSLQKRDPTTYTTITRIVSSTIRLSGAPITKTVTTTPTAAPNSDNSNSNDDSDIYVTAYVTVSPIYVTNTATAYVTKVVSIAPRNVELEHVSVSHSTIYNPDGSASVAEIPLFAPANQQNENENPNENHNETDPNETTESPKKTRTPYAPQIPAMAQGLSNGWSVLYLYLIV